MELVLFADPCLQNFHWNEDYTEVRRRERADEVTVNRDKRLVATVGTGVTSDLWGSAQPPVSAAPPTPTQTITDTHLRQDGLWWMATCEPWGQPVVTCNFGLPVVFACMCMFVLIIYTIHFSLVVVFNSPEKLRFCWSFVHTWNFCYNLKIIDPVLIFFND